ncbi:amidohydrolase family protein [Ventrimonas sp. CLA-AP-H27]|uniref:Amidohydrolase family protein n=1 Tax=Ventrimonas faecis TaxID=3133170 RepID=A0ABV1HQ93_9FIRM
MKQKQTFALKGNLIYTKEIGTLEILEQHYLVCEEGKVQGIYPELPEQLCGIPVEELGDRLIIPGLTDLHVHAPQYSFRSLNMDMELLEWLETNTFPEESKFQDLDYAKKAYGIFTENVKHSATTRACIFGTIHNEATLLLMDQLEEAGIAAMVGKVNMDRNSPDYLRETSAEESAKATRAWIQAVAERHYERVQPILTPRFTPSCSDELMELLHGIQKETGLSVQSHLSENPGEIAWVQELCPWSKFYGDAYDHFGMFGGECRTIMAHCVYSGDEEIQRMKENGVFIAHCPESNTNLSSGIAPVRRYLDEQIPVGLGSDVAGGTTENLFAAMRHAIQASKLRWRLSDQSLQPLNMEEVFYLASKGGGAFFGKVGSFEPGYEFDAVILDDARLEHPQPLNVKQRLERVIYLGDEREVAGKYVAGRKVL